MVYLVVKAGMNLTHFVSFVLFLFVIFWSGNMKLWCSSILIYQDYYSIRIESQALSLSAERKLFLLLVQWQGAENAPLYSPFSPSRCCMSMRLNIHWLPNYMACRMRTQLPSMAFSMSIVFLSYYCLFFPDVVYFHVFHSDTFSFYLCCAVNCFWKIFARHNRCCK